MSITRTQLIQSNNTGNLGAYDTGTITPSANSFVILIFRFKHSTAGTPTLGVTSNAGLSLTWSLIKRNDYDTVASPTDCTAMYGALTGATPGSGTIHITTSITASGLIWEVAQWDGCDLSGGTVASVIQQTGSGQSDTAGTTFTDTFGSAVSTGNAVVSAMGGANKNAPALTWNNSFTKDTDVGSGESTAYDLGTGHILSGFTGTSHTATSATSQIWGMVGAELKASSGSATTDADSGTLTDALNALDAADVSTEAGTLAEALGTIPVTLTNSDTASLSESTAASLTQISTSSDSGTLVESAVLTEALGIGESVTVTEGVGIAMQASTADSSTTSEALALTASLIGSDAATLSESAVTSSTGGITDTDSATLTESAVASLAIGPSESLTVTEAVGIDMQASISESGTVGDALIGSLQVAQTDTGTLAETQVASQSGGTAITDSDSFAVQEAISALLASLSDTEAFALAEAAVVPQPAGPGEVGIPVRYLGKKWYQTIPPKAYWTPGSR